MTGRPCRKLWTAVVAAWLLWSMAPATSTAQNEQEGARTARVRLTFDVAAPRLAGAAETRRWVEGELHSRLGLAGTDRLAVDERTRSLGEYTIVRLSQTAKGLPIVYRESRLLLDGDRRPVHLLGYHASFRVPPDPIPRLSITEAFAAAGGRADDPSSSRLVFWPAGNELRLSYQLEGSFPPAAEAVAPLERVFVDATTAEILDRLSLTPRALDRRVHDFGLVCRNEGIRHLMGYSQYFLAVSNAPLVRAERYRVGARLAERYFRVLGSLHAFLRVTLDMDGVDDYGGPMKVVIGLRYHPDTPWAQCIGDTNNASWVGHDHPPFFDPTGFALLPYPAVEFDEMIGHEFTHGIIRHSSDLIYKEESGALNESISDVIGATFGAWLRNGARPDFNVPIRMTSRDWIIEGPGGPIRNLRYPNSINGLPDHYDHYEYGAGVHFNSSIVNQAFYLLSEGGQHPRLRRGPAVDGISVMKAMRIFAVGGAFLLTPDADFEDARFAFARAAEIFHGEGSPEWNATHTAMDAVGIDGYWQRVPPPGTSREPRAPTPPSPETDPGPPPTDPDEGENGGGGGDPPPPIAQPASTNLLILLLILVLVLLLATAVVYHYRLGRPAPVLATPTPVPPTPIPPPSPRPQPAPPRPEPMLGVLQPMDGSPPIQLSHTRLSSPDGLLIGRDPGLCDVALQNSSVSRRHLRLRLSGGRFLVEDLNSMDGTYLDGTRLKPFEPRPLASGQTLGVAGQQLYLRLER